MHRRLLLSLVLSLAFAGAARAAAAGLSDDDMVRLCRRELEGRLFEGGARGEAFIAAQEIRRARDRVTLHLDLASGEGRKTAGACVFRDGKLFDVN